MTNSIKRYWCRSFNNILDHTGFLYNPDDKYFFGKEIQDIEDITNNSCVLLCNIPKEASSEFYAYYKKEQGKDLDNAHSFYDISSYANENRLIKDIFESNIIEIWKQIGRAHV